MHPFDCTCGACELGSRVGRCAGGAATSYVNNPPSGIGVAVIALAVSVGAMWLVKRLVK